MKFIFALLFAIPTYGVSILILFGYMFYKTKNLKSNLNNAIKFLAKENSVIAVCFTEINYVQALAFVSEFGKMIKKTGTYIEFNIAIEGCIYAVILDREPNGKGIVLNAKNIHWVMHVHMWLSKYLSYKYVPTFTEIPLLTSIVLGSAIHPEYSYNVKEISVYLCKSKSLEKLYLQHNLIAELPEEIGDLENLKDLKLGGNCLKKLPKTIGNLKNLEILTAWSNELVEIPPEIGQLSNLKGLSFWGNPLAKLPEEITKLTKLEILELGLMPNLTLSPSQKIWINNLIESGCDVWLDEPDNSSATAKV